MQSPLQLSENSSEFFPRAPAYLPCKGQVQQGREDAGVAVWLWTTAGLQKNVPLTERGLDFFVPGHFFSRVERGQARIGSLNSFSVLGFSSIE